MKIKQILLKLFSDKELQEELMKRDSISGKLANDVLGLKEKIDENKIFLRIKRAVPEFVDLLKLRKYYLSNQLFLSTNKDELNFTNGRRMEDELLIRRIEGAKEIKEKENKTETGIGIENEQLKEIEKGLQNIKEKLTP
jgi:hypothetical protein